MSQQSDEHASSRFSDTRKILNTHLRSHPEHHHLDDNQYEPFVAHIETAHMQKKIGIYQSSANRCDNPKSILISA
ncbi:hypothetical protein D3C84_1252640 [compost metagenome]